MKRPLSGKRFFHAQGAAWAGQGQNIRTAHFGGMPLWAQNAFCDGVMGVELRRRPAWVEAAK